MNQKTICPVCGSSSLNQFLQRNQIPIHQNLVMKNREAAVQIERGDLNMLVCHECGFIFNQAFEWAKIAYGENYDNTQSHSPYFEQYLDKITHYLISEKNVRNSKIVEVGCGKGGFLKGLIDYKGANNIGYGFDPSYVGPRADLDGRLIFEQRYYGPDCTDIAADVVICRHVIEHVPSPIELLTAVRKALEQSPHARVFFETPCVEWILRNQVIWDFFYEHCSLFSKASLTTAFERAGFQVDKVQHIFKSQYLWLEASLPNKPLKITKNSGEMSQLAEQFTVSEQKLKTAWPHKIQSLLTKGKIAVWGAGAKGITFVNLIDPFGQILDCIVDLNPNKQGCYAPGTAHPIVNYQELQKRGVTHAILMNPNYRDENMGLLSNAKIQVELVE
ncbi:NDP-hexose methyltransferase protein [Beggiatoa sp. PS]|nr:NDP-hexose methyltransferase protein [Beggiatoa sp. PS]